MDEPFEEVLPFVVPANTWLGRYHWEHLPIGLNLSSNSLNSLVEGALIKRPGLTNFVKIMDNILIYVETLEELVEQLWHSSRFGTRGT